jgi:CMP-N,N'-diacetyllegionaminic acid synthase
MNNLILIPARAGSTRVKGKNIRELAGKPLLGHIVENALASKSARVVISTNSQEIAAVGEKYGAEIPFYRPPELSNANAASIWVILHALLWFKEHENWQPEMVAFCPPTNPFTRPETISTMFRTLAEKKEVDSIVTITQPKTHPFRVVRVREDDLLKVGAIEIDGKTILDIERSQDWPEVWEGTPACRMTRAGYFYNLIQPQQNIEEISGRTYNPDNCIAQPISSMEAFDIDDEHDFKMAELHLGTSP